MHVRGARLHEWASEGSRRWSDGPCDHTISSWTIEASTRSNLNFYCLHMRMQAMLARMARIRACMGMHAQAHRWGCIAGHFAVCQVDHRASTSSKLKREQRAALFVPAAIRQQPIDPARWPILPTQKQPHRPSQRWQPCSCHRQPLTHIHPPTAACCGAADS